MSWMGGLGGDTSGINEATARLEEDSTPKAPPAILWITERGVRRWAGTVPTHDSGHVQGRGPGLCAGSGDAGAAAPRRRRSSRLGSRARRAGPSTGRPGRRGIGDLAAGHAITDTDIRVTAARDRPRIDGHGLPGESRRAIGGRGRRERMPTAPRPSGVDPRPRPRPALGADRRGAALLRGPHRPEQPAARQRLARQRGSGGADGLPGSRPAHGARPAQPGCRTPPGPRAGRHRPGGSVGDPWGHQLFGVRGSAPQRPGRGVAGHRRPAARHRRGGRPGHPSGDRGPGAQSDQPGDCGGARATGGAGSVAARGPQRHIGVRPQHRLDRRAPMDQAPAVHMWADRQHGVLTVVDDGRVSDIKRGRAARNAKLASIPVGFAGRTALGFGKRLAGKSQDEVNAELMEKAAKQLFTVLGELKGGAMKVGQALSVMEAAIPEEFGEPYREALTKLQKDAPPLPADKVHRVLDAQLGTKWRQRFSEFDDTAVASASIGQVHKGVWSDGREVAVKIQYPGADEALRADLKTLRRMVGGVKQLAPGADVQGVVDELLERVEMELDYRLEAEHQRAFARGDHDAPHFVVPAIVASAPKVVIAEWIEGVPLSQIIAKGTVAQRDLCGARLTELTLGAPARVEMMHGDAHPGNFMLMSGDRLGVIDFGAVAPLPGGFPTDLGRIFRLGADKDYG